VKHSVIRYGEALEKEFSDNQLVVFLCGPSETRRPEAGAELRHRLKVALSKANFEVVLGEDDGLENLQAKYGLYAHENERKFVADQMAAIVLVADSPGSFCELGMFVHSQIELGQSSSQDFILIANIKYKDAPSYFNLGPAKLVGDFWVVHYVNFEDFDPSVVVERLRRRRAIWISDLRGRPRRA
jgi:hypothetical protein